MNNSITIFAPKTEVSLVDIRMDSKAYPRIKSMPEPVAVDGLASVIAMAFVYTGREYTPESLVLIASALYKELMADSRGIGTGNISVEEIGRAVNRAVLGETEMFGINVSSLYKVICSYCTGEGHDAQKAANLRRADERAKALKGTAVGAMMDAFAGRMIKASKK